MSVYVYPFDCLYTLSILGLRFENYCLIKFEVDIIKGKQQPKAASQISYNFQLDEFSCGNSLAFSFKIYYSMSRMCSYQLLYSQNHFKRLCKSRLHG